MQSRRGRSYHAPANHPVSSSSVAGARITGQKGSGREIRAAWPATLGPFFAGLTALLLVASQYKGLDHDENQFIAGAYLFAKHGLLPYIDFPYFHLPTLILPYAALFHLTNHLLAATRLFSAACGLATVLLLAAYAGRLFRSESDAVRVGMMVGSAVLLAGSRLFVYTSGLAWNHDLSVLLAVAAALALLPAARGSDRWARAAGCGLLLGLAIGVRASFIPLVPPFLIGIYALPGDGRSLSRKLVSMAAFGAGLTLALLPALLLLAAAPDRFVFGNLTYATLNTAYREAIGYHRAMSVVGKFLYFLERAAQPGNLVILILFGAVIFKLGWRNLVSRAAREVGFLVGLIPFVLAGAFAPTPSFRQYFYVLLPFSLLAALGGLAWLRRRVPARGLMRLFAVLALLAMVRGAMLYWKVFHDRWGAGPVTAEVHEIGVAMRDRAGPGAVLTLAPVYPLEGGLDVYRPFVTGPFAWRTAPLLSPADRRRFGVVAPADLQTFLADRPAAALLVGVESDDGLELPLVAYARDAGYRVVRLIHTGPTLWLRPTHPAQ